MLSSCFIEQCSPQASIPAELAVLDYPDLLLICLAFARSVVNLLV
jgi:hypothetical protein